MKFSNILFILLLTACTSPQTADLKRQIASIAQKINIDFDIKNPTPIRLVKAFSYALPLSTVAVCYKFDHEAYSRRIEVLQSKIEGNYNMSLEQILIHEVTHCNFDMPHYDAEPDIMNTYVLDRDYYLENRTKLIYNLKKRLKK